MNFVIVYFHSIYYTLEAFIAEMWEILEIECAQQKYEICQKSLCLELK